MINVKPSLTHQEKEAAGPIGHETMSSELLYAVNYHTWTHGWISPFIRGRVLDIGGGTGNHLRELSSLELVSIDLSEDCVSDMVSRYKSRTGWSFHACDITDDSVIQIFRNRKLRYYPFMQCV